MRNFSTLFILLFISGYSFSQNLSKIYLTDAESSEPLYGAIVMLPELKLNGVSDENGILNISKIPNGKHRLIVKLVGYITVSDSFVFPINDTLKISLTSLDNESDEIEIVSTRSSRSIKDIPTRVEYIAGEELDEKANMKPGDIRMLLAESTGIQTQQTSATSANASIRIQGLDGRYTQILKDGFPLYAGFSGGLGLLQTPPLDLKQAEVIKGSSSTLYGGGAIAGMVNLISKTPTKDGEIKLLVNGTSAKGLDLNGFYQQRFNKIGLTLYLASNSNKPYDPANIGFSAIPKFIRYTLNPRLYFYPNKSTKIMVGVNTVVEERKGGNMSLLNDELGIPERYFEYNNTKRLSTQFHSEFKLKNKGIINFKNSISFFKRALSTNVLSFNGEQTNTFSEINYSKAYKNLEWIGGLNNWTENFKHTSLAYEQTTFGLFIQNTWKATPKLSVESGLRNDFVINYGNILLPRLSLLYKFIPSLTLRLGGGRGYKAPTIFTEETEKIHYQFLVPISDKTNKMEKSLGLNADVNYRFYSANNKWSFNINQLFFYTKINSPLLLNHFYNIIPVYYQLINSMDVIDSKGGETNIKIGFSDFKLFIGYTITRTGLETSSGFKRLPLTPRNRLNTVLMYELEGKWKIGLEAYYFSKQTLSDGLTGKEYWICGFMVERLWEKFSVFINFENFLDARQTRFDSIYTGSNDNPVFRDIYAPLDGFVINGGLKYFPFGDACCKK